MRRKTIAMLLIALMLITSIPTGYAVTYKTASVVEVIGMVSILKAGGEKAFTPDLKTVLEHGDRIITGKGASIALKIEGDKYLKVGEKTYMSLSELMSEAESGGDSTNIKLFTGKVWASINKPLGGDDSFKIETPTAVMGAKGTQFYVKYTLAPSSEGTSDLSGTTELVVLNGKVGMKTTLPTGARTGEGPTGQEVEIDLIANQSLALDPRLIEGLSKRLEALLESGVKIEDISIQEIVKEVALVERIEAVNLDLFILEIIAETPDAYDPALTEGLDALIEQKQQQPPADLDFDEFLNTIIYGLGANLDPTQQLPPIPPVPASPTSGGSGGSSSGDSGSEPVLPSILVTGHGGQNNFQNRSITMGTPVTLMYDVTPSDVRFGVSISNGSVANVQVSRQENRRDVMLTPVGVGTTTVTLTATKPGYSTFSSTFLVTVTQQTQSLSIVSTDHTSTGVVGTPKIGDTITLNVVMSDGQPAGARVGYSVAIQEPSGTSAIGRINIDSSSNVLTIPQTFIHNTNGVTSIVGKRLDFVASIIGQSGGAVGATIGVVTESTVIPTDYFNIVFDATLGGYKITQFYPTGPSFNLPEVTNVIIPSQYDDGNNGLQSIKEIGTTAFANKGLQSVLLPNGLVKIGDYAFKANQIVEVSMPSSVTTIGVEAFMTNSISSLSLGSGLEAIGSSAFASNQLTEILIPSTLVSIGSSAFAGNNIVSITMPEALEIGDISGDHFTFGDNDAGDFPFKTIYDSSYRLAGRYYWSGTVWEYDASTASAVLETKTLTEAEVIAGGQTFTITLTGATWHEDIAVEPDLMTALLDALTGVEGIAIESMQVTRTSDDAVTITLPASAGYYITEDKSVEITIPSMSTDAGSEISATGSVTIANMHPVITTSSLIGAPSSDYDQTLTIDVAFDRYVLTPLKTHVILGGVYGGQTVESVQLLGDRALNVRITGNVSAGTGTIEIAGGAFVGNVNSNSLLVTTAPQSPALDMVEIHVANGTLTNTSEQMEYSINSTDGIDGDWIQCNPELTSVLNFDMGPVYVREMDAPANTHLVATIPEPASAPTDVDLNTQTGAITNTMDGMEYSIDGGTTWLLAGGFDSLTPTQIYALTEQHGFKTRYVATEFTLPSYTQELILGPSDSAYDFDDRMYYWPDHSLDADSGAVLLYRTQNQDNSWNEWKLATGTGDHILMIEDPQSYGGKMIEFAHIAAPDQVRSPSSGISYAWVNLTHVSYDGDTLNNTTTNMEYSIDGGPWISCDEGETVFGVHPNVTVRDKYAPTNSKVFP